MGRVHERMRRSLYGFVRSRCYEDRDGRESINVLSESDVEAWMMDKFGFVDYRLSCFLFSEGEVLADTRCRGSLQQITVIIEEESYEDDS